jgi:phosphoribosylamine--glycine ligase
VRARQRGDRPRRGDPRGRDLVAAAVAAGVDLVVVGPEAPLVDGLADAMRDAGLVCFGPSASAARLEGSKAFAKEIMEAAGVPTAAHRVVGTVEEGLAAITSYPAVIKATAWRRARAWSSPPARPRPARRSRLMLVARRFGDAPVVVEAFLEGDELSVLALCDGERAVPLAPARDFKRIGDGDTGPNTGGMGAFSPVPEIDDATLARIVREVHQPVVDELARRGTPFHGVLYAGLMLRPGGFDVLEFNVRFGDPETQVVLPRLRSDLVDLLERATRPGGLRGVELEWDPRAAVTVVLASGGYPESSSSGDVIAGLEAAAGAAEITHAGTAQRGGDIVTAGGRVLNVTALGDDRAAARAAAYAAADMIDFDGRQLRRDIAQ